MSSGGARVTVLIANPSPDVYGSDLQMLESVGACVARGWRVVVAVPRDGALVPRLRERGAEVRFAGFPVLRRADQSPLALASLAGGAAAAVPRLVRLIRELQPSVVYVNTLTLPWWLLAARIARVPSVCHLHEAENTDRALVRRALLTPLRLADRVIVISRSAMTVMLDGDAVLVDRARLVYNGVPTPPEPPTPPARRAPLRLTVVGRLSPRKAPHVALDAVGLLRQRGEDVVLELAGTPFAGYEWYETQLRARAAEPDLAGAVTFSGYCQPIWPVLARSDVVLAPSVREPFGNAVVEAQLAGRPVVAAAALGHLETVVDGETGLLVPPEDAPALAAAVARLVADEDLASALAATARQRAVARFGTERYGAEVTAVLEELTGQLVAS